MFNENVNEFLEDLSSSKPTPGGGSVSALSGSIATALGLMVGSLTLKKSKSNAEKEALQEVIQYARGLLQEMNELALADIEVFNRLSEAYRMPRSTEEEINLRNHVLQIALTGAVEVPMKVARNCSLVLDILELFYEKGTKMAVSDIAVGAWCCLAALKGAKFNTLINLKMMKDEEQCTRILEELDRLEKEIESRCFQMSDRIEDELMRNKK